MNDLLREVIDAHGSLDRWNAFSTVSARIVSGGEFWATKGIATDANPRSITTKTQEELATITPYGAPEFVMTFAPDRVVIRNSRAETIAGRDNPRSAFDGHGVDTPWDPLDRAYFSGYALWTYLSTPFLLAMPGVAVQEVAPWYESGEAWRVLRATFPPAIATHSTVQDFYFGPDFLLRRHDYQVDVSGGLAAAQYVHDFIEIQGVRFPSRRRVHPRGADMRPDRSHTLVWIDLSDFELR